MPTRDERTVMPFGVMRAHFQAVGHAHLISNLLDFGLDVQEAIGVASVFANRKGVVEVVTTREKQVTLLSSGIG